METIKQYLKDNTTLRAMLIIDKTKIPFGALYSKYLNIAPIKFNMTLDERRDKYGLFTIKQLEDEFEKTC